MNEAELLAERVAIIEKELDRINERNVRVELDKAWETSRFRVLSITFITYLIAMLLFYVLGVSDYYLSALIPTVGYFLSTQSLPFIKKWWIGKGREYN